MPAWWVVEGEGGQGRAQVSEKKMRAQLHLRKEEENPGDAEKCDTEWKGEGEVRAGRREESERMRILGCPPTHPIDTAPAVPSSPHRAAALSRSRMPSRALPHVYAGQCMFRNGAIIMVM